MPPGVTSTLFYWIPCLAFLAHIAEEWPRFPAWATRHFGTTTRAFYAYSHVVLVAAAVTVSALATSGPAGGPFALLAIAGQWLMCSNALFHLATSALFREYSPGVVTGTTLFLPGTAFVTVVTLREQLLSVPQLALAIALGFAGGGLVIASLWLDMNYDWRLHRGEPKALRARGG